MSRRYNQLSRRDFLKLSAVGVGGFLLSGCKYPLRMKATPTQQPIVPSLQPTHLDLPQNTPSPVPVILEIPQIASSPVSGGIADTILVNGRVVVMDNANTITQAVAVVGDKILATGNSEAMRALASPTASIIDLAGRAVTPGFVDAHNHMYAKGLVGTAYIDINPPAVRTVDELQEKIVDGCAKKGAGKWVILQGYISFEGNYPDKNMIDPVSPDNPVMLINQGGHMGAVNSYALKLAGVNASTPDPQFGKLLRDSKGNPTGALVNHSAMDLFRRLWAEEVLTDTIRYQAILKSQPEYISYGLTSIGDVNVRGLTAMEAYFENARQNKMSLRAYVLNTIEYYSEVDGRADDINALIYESDFMHFGGYKFLVDGAMEAAYTHEPHTGLVWDLATWDGEALKEAASIFHGLGYQCSFHVIGDAAVDMALDAIEYAMNAAPRPDPRHRLEHAVLNSAAALQRQRDLGVVVSTQPHAIYLAGDRLIEMLGEERAMRVIPTRSWLDLGVPLSLSSDAPTLPWWQPPQILAAAVTRFAFSKKVIGPEQVLTIDEAMRAYTMGGAYATYEDHLKGSLEPGKFADLLVWGVDPYSSSLTELLAENPIDITMIAGQVAFENV